MKNIYLQSELEVCYMKNLFYQKHNSTFHIISPCQWHVGVNVTSMCRNIFSVSFYYVIQEGTWWDIISTQYEKCNWQNICSHSGH